MQVFSTPFFVLISCISFIIIQNLRYCKQCCGSGYEIPCYFDLGIQDEKKSGSGMHILVLIFACHQKPNPSPETVPLKHVGCEECQTEGGAGSRQVQALQLGGIHDSGLLQYNNIMSYWFLSLILNTEAVF
jgi:hypothetical protein